MAAKQIIKIERHTKIKVENLLNVRGKNHGTWQSNKQASTIIGSCLQSPSFSLQWLKKTPATRTSCKFDKMKRKDEKLPPKLSRNSSYSIKSFWIPFNNRTVQIEEPCVSNMFSKFQLNRTIDTTRNMSKMDRISDGKVSDILSVNSASEKRKLNITDGYVIPR